MKSKLPEWLKPQELRKALRVGANQVTRMRKRKEIPEKFIRRIGPRDYRINRAFLEVR